MFSGFLVFVGFLVFLGFRFQVWGLGFSGLREQDSLTLNPKPRFPLNIH